MNTMNHQTGNESITSECDPYSMAWVMIDLINPARPILESQIQNGINRTHQETKIHSLRIKLSNLIHVNIRFHHGCCCQNQHRTLSFDDTNAQGTVLR